MKITYAVRYNSNHFRKSRGDKWLVVELEDGVEAAVLCSFPDKATALLEAKIRRVG